MLFTKAFISLALLLLPSTYAAVIKRDQCGSDPDCLPYYNSYDVTLNFDETNATTTGVPLPKGMPLDFTGFKLAAAPIGRNAKPHLAPSSGSNYIRAHDSTDPYNSTSIKSKGDIFKFRSFWFGCSKTIDWTPTPCKLTLTGYNPMSYTPQPVSSVTIEYESGNPGANGVAYLQEVKSEDLKDLSLANYYVLNTTGFSGFRPRLVLDDLSAVYYKYASY